jgi:hypothetical protein
VVENCLHGAKIANLKEIPARNYHINIILKQVKSDYNVITLRKYPYICNTNL